MRIQAFRDFSFACEEVTLYGEIIGWIRLPRTRMALTFTRGIFYYLDGKTIKHATGISRML